MEQYIVKVPLKNRELLTRNGGDKCVYLISFDLAGTNIQYEPGDVVGVYPQNDITELEKLLHLTPFRGDEKVIVNGRSEILLTWLKVAYELEHFPDKAFRELGENVKAGHMLKIEDLKRLEISDILPLLDFQNITPVKFLSWLKPIKPRYYSVASSQKKHPEAVELIVGLVNYNLEGKSKAGLTTGYLCERVHLGEKVSIFFRKTHFRLPTNHTTDVIMIGPGTGLAPFKAFLEERYAVGAKGKNWLFFGDRRRDFDFLLEETLTRYRSEGFLQRLDLAFSRDQEHKIYVQHKIIENGSEFWSWIQNGAYLYVCGDAKSMAKDVDAALLKVFSTCGGHIDAEQFVKKLRQEKRYQKDVY